MDYTFLSENYIWIIVVAVIVVMTIIGYIADKTNFGEKKPKKEEKINEVNNNEISNENIQVESVEQFNDYQNAENVDMSFEQNNEQINFPEPEILEPAQFENPEIVEPEIPADDFEMPMEETNDYLQDNIYNQEIIVDDNEQYKNDDENNFETSDYDNEQPEMVEQQVEATMNSESVANEQFVEEPQIDGIDFELPSIDKLNEEIAEVEEDEDVWKF